MDLGLEDYVRQQNIELYRKLLAEQPAVGQRRIVLEKLLSEENAKQAASSKARRLT
jgi:hypothetical protein